jgi:hypothetical protein
MMAVHREVTLFSLVKVTVSEMAAASTIEALMEAASTP